MSQKSSLPGSTSRPPSKAQYIDLNDGVDFLVSFGLFLLGIGFGFLLSRTVFDDGFRDAFSQMKLKEETAFIIANPPEGVTAECHASLLERAALVETAIQDGKARSVENAWKLPVPGC